MIDVKTLWRGAARAMTFMALLPGTLEIRMPYATDPCLVPVTVEPALATGPCTDPECSGCAGTAVIACLCPAPACGWEGPVRRLPLSCDDSTSQRGRVGPARPRR